MTQLPQDVIDHCQKHPGCKGCPLGTCTAPLVPVTDERYGQWLESRIEAVRQLDGGLKP
ncbi:hypothetical protein [Marinobacter nauticus]|uniref:hypothetical protein n=1 Tax=Marinobacter nauticus TaxID=2743 RepID=UPI000F18E3DE|nr:hypothetical protein [Marinobacter nauticus]RKR79199.1 hypothetical protein C7436_0637 [Marinobacter nauticus]